MLIAFFINGPASKQDSGHDLLELLDFFFSSLRKTAVSPRSILAAWDVLPGETSVPQRQKLHIDSIFAVQCFVSSKANFRSANLTSEVNFSMSFRE